MSRPSPRSVPSIASTALKQSALQAPLSKRLLFPNSDPPPLFASPAVPPELTAELYEFIALALRAHVNPWWTKITRYDKQFLPEITRIVAIVLRALEPRVLALDLPQLLFRDIPTLITQHYRDYRNASAKLSTSYSSAAAASLPHLFHQFQSHMALSADGTIDSEYYRQIVDHILKVCLPEEDYAPEAERFIVREIVLKIIVVDVLPKVTQPWFIQKTILDLAKPGPESDSATPLQVPEPATTAPPSSHFSFHTLIVFFLSAVQTLSGTCLALIHAYKHTVHTIKLVNQSPPPRPPATAPRVTPAISPSPERARSSLSTPSPLAIGSRSSSISSASSLPLPPPLSPPMLPQGDALIDKEVAELVIHGYAQAPLTMLAEIFTVHDRFAATAIASTGFMLAAMFTSFLDRLLPYLLHTALSPKSVTQVVTTAKRTLFPNGYPAVTPPDPTPEEQAETRRRLVQLGSKLHIPPILFGAHPEVTLGKALDPLSDAACNIHLAVFILDRVLMGLFPELGGGGEGS